MTLIIARILPTDGVDPKQPDAKGSSWVANSNHVGRVRGRPDGPGVCAHPSLLLPAAFKVGVQRYIGTLGIWEDRDCLLLVVKRGCVRFRVILGEVLLLGHVEVRDHLPPSEGRPESLHVTDDGKLIAEDGFAGLHRDDAAERLLLLLNRGGSDVGGVSEITSAVGEIGFYEFVKDL